MLTGIVLGFVVGALVGWAIPQPAFAAKAVAWVKAHLPGAVKTV